jgi:hypothetical protein
MARISQASIWILAVVLTCGATIGCQSRSDTPPPAPTYSSQSRDRYSELDATRGEPIIVQVQLTSVTPGAAAVETNPPPNPGESTTVKGDINMSTLSSLETLARVGSDFRSRASLAATNLAMHGHITRAGRTDNTDRDIYRVQIYFRQTDSTGSQGQSTTMELPVGKPTVIGTIAGNRSAVLTLRLPREREND